VWLGNGQERNWDLIVNYFGDSPQAFRHEGTRRIDSKGPKWPALHDFVGKLQEEIERYDYVWFPDDDLACDLATINALFDTCHEFGLNLAQPALSLDSIRGHLINLRNKSFRLRFTNFVEIMAPCFSRLFLRRCWPSFATNLSGWGLDFLWPTWISDPLKIAIIDSAVICHTRPGHGTQYNALEENNISPDEEIRQLLVRERLHPNPMTVGGIDLNGRLYTIWNGGHGQLIKNILTGYLPELANQPISLFKHISPIVDCVTRASAFGMASAASGAESRA